MKQSSPKTVVLKQYKNGGSVEIYADFNYKESDYKRIYACCKYFAKQGKRTIITPKIHYKDSLYKIVYKNLIGTKYEKNVLIFALTEYFMNMKVLLRRIIKTLFIKCAIEDLNNVRMSFWKIVD